MLMLMMLMLMTTTMMMREARKVAATATTRWDWRPMGEKEVGWTAPVSPISPIGSAAGVVLWALSNRLCHNRQPLTVLVPREAGNSAVLLLPLVLGLLPATAHGWLDANGTDFVVKPWSQLQTLAVRRRKRGWIAIQRPAACEPEHVVCVATPHNTNTRLTGRHWQHAQQLLLPCFSLFRRFPDLKPTLELRNGVLDTEILQALIDRLQVFQKGPMGCRETALAITNLEQAIHWLQHRQLDRQARAVRFTDEA